MRPPIYFNREEPDRHASRVCGKGNTWNYLCQRFAARSRRPGQSDEGTAGACCGPLAFRQQLLSTGVAICRVSSTVRPRKPSNPVRRAEEKAVAIALPTFIRPQLSQPVEKPPSGPQWLHEIKLDGYRIAARIDNGRVQLLTRTGLDWAGKYPSAIAALANLNVKTAYIDGELCGVDETGLPTFAHTQAATDGERNVQLVYYAFDLLHLDGWDVSALQLIERKALLEPLHVNKPGLQFNGHETGDGELILRHAGKLGFEGVVSKSIDAPYAPGNRGLWRKAKWLNRQEFVIVGWSHPEGSRPHLGALLLGYYTDDGKLIYAGRVGTGMPIKVLADLRRQLDPIARKTPPLNVPPSRKTRFGSPLFSRALGRAEACR